VLATWALFFHIMLIAQGRQALWQALVCVVGFCGA